MKDSLVAIARPEMMTLGGANSVMRLAMAKPSAAPALASTRAQLSSPSAARCSRTVIARSARAAPSWSPPRNSASASATTDVSEARSPSRPPPLRSGSTMRSPRSGLRPLAPRNSSPLCRMPRPRLRSTLTTRKSFSSRACPNQCSASVTRLTSLSIETGAPSRRVNSAPKATSRSLKIGLCRHRPAARSTTPGRPTQTPEISAISRSASQTQRRTPSSTRSAMTVAVCRSMRIGNASVRSTSALKLETATVI